jgi:DNA topoisomerase-1
MPSYVTLLIRNPASGASAVVRLLGTTLIRVSNVEYTRENHSFGLTTLRDRHVQISEATIQFEFRGKSGKHHTVRLNDRHLASIVKRCQDLPGYGLFQYLKRMTSTRRLIIRYKFTHA